MKSPDLKFQTEKISNGDFSAAMPNAGLHLYMFLTICVKGPFLSGCARTQIVQYQGRAAKSHAPPTALNTSSSFLAQPGFQKEHLGSMVEKKFAG